MNNIDIEDLDKVKSLILSPDKNNQLLGWQMDKNLFNSKCKSIFEEEYKELLYLLDLDIKGLLAIKKLDISYRGLYDLPVIPPNVTSLDCDGNQLTSLPDLPNVTYLDCRNNQLTSLPDLPNVTYLDCDGNLSNKI